MKTKELIRLLQKVDPSGETECNCNGEDIWTVEGLPGYYDGSYQVLIRDPAQAPFYDITGVKVTREGNKVCIRTMSIEEVIYDDIDAEIILHSSLADFQKASYREKVNKAVEQAKLFNSQISSVSAIKPTP